MKHSSTLVRRALFPHRQSTYGPLIRLVLGAIVLLLLWLTLRTVALADIWIVLRRLSLWSVVMLIVVNALLVLTFSARWWLFLRALGYPINYLTLARYRLASFGVSYFTPGPHFGGEPLQVYLLTRRHNIPQSDAITAVTLDKIVEMIFNFTFLVVGLAIVLQRQLLIERVEATSIGYALALLAIPAGLLMLLWAGVHPLSGTLALLGKVYPRGSRQPKAKPARLIQTIRHSEDQIAQLCQTKPSVLLLAILVSLLNWIGLLGEFWLATYVLGFSLSPVEAVTALVAMRVAILLPMPAGLGTLEASQVIAMTSLGLGAAAGISLSLLIRARDVVLGLMGLWLAGVDVREGATGGREDGKTGGREDGKTG